MTGKGFAIFAQYLANVKLPVMENGFIRIIEQEALDDLKKRLSFKVKWEDLINGTLDPMNFQKELQMAKSETINIFKLQCEQFGNVEPRKEFLEEIDRFVDGKTAEIVLQLLELL